MVMYLIKGEAVFRGSWEHYSIRPAKSTSPFLAPRGYKLWDVIFDPQELFLDLVRELKGRSKLTIQGR